jgi:hypothetical protein
MSDEYLDQCEKAVERVFKERRDGQKPIQSWYLQLASTDPDHQGKGTSNQLFACKLFPETSTQGWSAA